MSPIECALSRREALRTIGAGTAAVALGAPALARPDEKFELRYVLGSCMYGTTALAEILPEVERSGADAIDIWPRVHGNQREQIETMGHDAFASLLEKHDVKLGILTHYNLGPFKLGPQLPFAKRFGAKMIVCSSGGPKGLKGDKLAEAMQAFVKKMEPHVRAAAEHGVRIAIENHGGSLLSSPDSVQRFADAVRKAKLGDHMGVAFAPYHLPQDAKLLAKLIKELGPLLFHVYAWQHGKGCHKKLPKEDELLQMPGRGTLDFAPMLKAMAAIEYTGWTEVFMHPVPRGIPILDTTDAVTKEINRARTYLEAQLAS